ncbi:nitroreductase family protein [Streptococcus ovuberis]|uniref:Nitroreductase family protein n=1 Tax=Streptococcus ovuberis TaxID=1936207 RepID=A0A7X6MX93_9STRE|nr:nitroreductase family protein [Streptococcus ovuberis]NKZ20055.1 nitroreductase family protein [Streptococcus ovuberis]
MKFLELNKKRHAYKTFNDKPVDLKDIRTAIEVATLAPSANNIQPWKFVIVKERKAQLAEHMFGANASQANSAQYVVALFTDTDLGKRSRKIARVGIKDLPEEFLEHFMRTLPARFSQYDEQTKSDYLALNAGLVAMNFVLALTDQKIASNIILGFDKTKVNEVLDIDSRFRPELLITVGYSDDKPEPSYRLPVDEVIEHR